LYSLIRSARNFILACFNALHIDLHIAIGKTIFCASPRNVGRVGTGNKRLGRYASGVDTSAAKLVALNNRDRHASGRKPPSQRRACLTGANDDGVEVL